MACAVLTNDLQYDLINKNPERQAAISAVSRRMVRFLTEMRARQVPIVHLQLINREDDPRAERYNGRLPATRGSDGARIVAEFYEPSDIVVEKNKDSGFFETELHDVLQQLGIDTVILLGMQTQICIQTTAADAYFRGYHVIVAPDGVVSARREDKARALRWLEAYCATLMTTVEIVDKLTREALPDFELVPIP